MNKLHVLFALFLLTPTTILAQDNELLSWYFADCGKQKVIKCSEPGLIAWASNSVKTGNDWTSVHAQAFQDGKMTIDVYTIRGKYKQVITYPKIGGAPRTDYQTSVRVACPDKAITEALAGPCYEWRTANMNFPDLLKHPKVKQCLKQLAELPPFTGYLQ